MMNTTNNTEQCPEITKHPTVCTMGELMLRDGQSDGKMFTCLWQLHWLWMNAHCVVRVNWGLIAVTIDYDKQTWSRPLTPLSFYHQEIINKAKTFFLFLISSRLCTVIVDSTWDRKSTKLQSSTLCETREASHCWSEALLIKWTVILNQNNLNTRISV